MNSGLVHSRVGNRILSNIVILQVSSIDKKNGMTAFNNVRLIRLQIKNQC